ncbi:glycosyltransferase family 2 protein [Candidatus Falkowbacteria bacterium]|nr:glycosyltransferase family 2 protein [Candidatus Falkowbacteria bacterium]
MDLSIIIVNYNTRDKTLACLASLARADFFGLEKEVILVDNDSSEPIEQDAKRALEGLVFIKNSANVGMGAGNNVGIRQSRGEFVLVLNPDTEVEPKAIATMVYYLRQNPGTGLVGPELVYPDGTPQDSCYRYPNLVLPLVRRTFLGGFAKDYLDYYLLKNLDLKKPQAVDWIMGSCLLIRRKVLDQVGLFDERFFMYFEDTDLCRRINLAGFKVVYLPSARVVHHHSRASAKKHWLVALFANKMSRVHLCSLLKYSLKWKFK